MLHLSLMPEITSRLSTALADHYKIEREIGSGGMALVYLAEDLKLHRQVAIKVLRPELAVSLGADRFVQEIEVTAKLQHPQILPLYEAGEADEFLYYVMPYVEGETLRDRLTRDGKLSLDDALKITDDVAAALGYAHEHGIVHRDIKPENILLTSGRAVVADFGIARAVEVAGGERLTGTGLAVGTPAYMSPEQAMGLEEVDARSDVYSLGCVLYEMVSGHAPFTGQTPRSVIAKHAVDTVPDLHTSDPAIPLYVKRAVEKALAKRPSERFQSVKEFVEVLGSGTVVRAVHRPWRRPALLGGVLVVVVGAAMVVGRWISATAAGEPEHPQTAIAVLPFENLSADGPHGYFAGGLHDVLLTQFAKVAALSVRGRTSVMGYAGTTKSIKQIGEELEVGTLLVAGVQVVGNRLRVNVQLIDAATDEHLWAELYDRTLDDAFAIQSDVAQQVVMAVGAALSSTEQQRVAEAPTANAEAYRLYLQGQEYYRRPGDQRQNFESAQQLYERALELDATFALAHAALSAVNGWMSWFRYDPSPERLARQREEAETALRLAPELPQAHIAMGLVHYVRRDWQAALEEYGIALKGLPNDAWLWHVIGSVHRRLGNWDEVVAAFERAAQLDPRDANLFEGLGGITYRMTHRYAEAVRAFNRALTLDPGFYMAAADKGWVYIEWRGELDTLRAVLDRLPQEEALGRHLGSATLQRATLLLWGRQADSLLGLLAAARPRVMGGYAEFSPASLYAAWAHQLRGDRAAARGAFDSALVFLDSVMQDLPNDWAVHAARGLVLAGLGRREAALREARWLEQSVVYREDAFFGPLVAGNRAWILAQAGAAEAALDEIERLLVAPSFFVTVHTLRLDPRWDPIREHPRFRRLLEQYEN